MTIPFRAPADDVKLMQRIERFIFGDNLLHDINLNFPGAKARAGRGRGKNHRFIDLSQQRFGRLTAVALDPVRVCGRTVWRCVCDCGNECLVSAAHLRDGHTTSCGCLRREKISKRCLIDLTGRKFGRLTVIGRVPERAHGHIVWHCVCDCGNERLVVGQLLRAGKTTSCGCFRREKTTERNTTHGHAHTRLYGIWKAIKARCFNPNSTSYPWYGGREDAPITMHPEWRNDFMAFYRYVIEHLGEPPRDKTLDRSDNSRGYEPGNLQWATKSEQQANRRPYKRKARRASLEEINKFANALKRAAGGKS